jgi:hypothetical protein
VRATDEITGVLVRDEPARALTAVLDARAGLEAAAARLAARQAPAEALAGWTRPWPPAPRPTRPATAVSGSSS